MEKVISYHVFSDNFDDFVNSLEEALRIYDKLDKEGYGRIRLYKNISNNITDINDEVEEEFIKGKGDFPY